MNNNSQNRVWFSGDHHFSHYNIMRYCNRPFQTAKEMNEALIANWNSVVKPNDSVYHLGDFAFERNPLDVEVLRKRLNGWIYLILGNHDRQAVLAASGFIWKRDLAQIKIGEQKITLCHYAMRTWNCSHHGAFSLHGHSHGTLPDDPNLLSCDVGVDAWNFTPVSFEQIQEVMSKKTFVPIDGKD